LGSEIRKKPIPDPGFEVGKALDPGSGSGTLYLRSIPIWQSKLTYVQPPDSAKRAVPADPDCGGRLHSELCREPPEVTSHQAIQGCQGSQVHMARTVPPRSDLEAVLCPDPAFYVNPDSRVLMTKS
jgi:hypothetical protein